MLRSYAELVKRVPLLNLVVENGDTEALEALYKNVLSFFVTMSNANEICSYAKDLTWREVTTLESSSLLSSNGSMTFMDIRPLH